MGDFFLDKYLIIDPALEEVSVETGLPAHQVVDRRCSPGAAGTVTSNLSALEVGRIYAVGCIGDDGEGYELRRGLARTRVDTTHLLVREDWFTPTYTKPMLRQPNGSEVETNRQDIKNRGQTPDEIIAALISELHAVLPQVNAVIIADQVEAPNEGLITDRVRDELAFLAETYPDTIFFADSRGNIGRFRHLIVKPNAVEACRVFDPNSREPVPLLKAAEAGRALSERTGRPVYVTVGEHGLLVATPAGVSHVPGIKVAGPIDIVGAGDSTTAGIVASLCAGATLEEAGVVGCLVASITIQQLGTTGTASPDQVLARLEEVGDQEITRL